MSRRIFSCLSLVISFLENPRAVAIVPYVEEVAQLANGTASWAREPYYILVVAIQGYEGWNVPLLDANAKMM